MPCCCIAATICSDSEALTRTSFAPWPISRGLTIWSARLERRTLLEKPQPRLGRPARGPVSGSSVLVRRFFRLAYPGWQSFPCAPRGRQRRPPISTDSLLEGDGFEPSVPRQKDNAFRDSSFPTCARHRRLRKRSPPRPAAASSSVDPVRMNAELTRQLGDRPVPPTAATTTPSL
jgi:hypothetical protein